MTNAQIFTVMGMLWLLIGMVKLAHEIKEKQKEDRKHGIEKHWWEY